jgi:hypothetical protein
MKNPGTSELFLYWNRLRDGKPAPHRTQIEPIDIRNFLADTFILEQGMKDTASFRLAGTRVCSIYGRELKDFSFYSLFSLGDSGLMRRIISSCFVDKTVCVVNYDGISQQRRVAKFEAIFMPLEGKNESARIFGAIFANEKPFWLGVDAIKESRVTGIRMIDPEKEHIFLDNRPSVVVPPMGPKAEHISGPDSLSLLEPNTTKKIRHLTVITGGLADD